MQGKELLGLARKAIETHFSGEELHIDEATKKNYGKKQGVFVTLHKNDELRGCIGFAEPHFPLYEALTTAARAAAFSDPRFFPLQKDEVKEIKIEISVLTVPELIKVEKPEEYLKKINIGKDGLIIRSTFTSGLLLPQVFTEHKCTVKQALDMTCQKAGLGTDAWNDLNNKIYKFQAIIYKE